MNDVAVNEAAGAAEVTVDEAPKVFKVKIKGGVGEVEVIGAKVHDNVYDAVFMLGLETMVNSVGMSKILPGVTKLEGKEKEERVTAILKQAEANVKGLYDGTISKGRAAGPKASGAEQTEAMRLAKMLVKDHIRASGQKIGAYSAKEITEAAKKVLAGNPRLYEQAKANLAARSAEAKTTGGLDLTNLFGEKANSEEVKAKPKVPPKPKAKGEKPALSAKQAGLVAPRAKPGTAPAHGTTH